MFYPHKYSISYFYFFPPTRLSTARTSKRPENCGTLSWRKGTPNTPTCGWSIITLKGQSVHILMAETVKKNGNIFVDKHFVCFTSCVDLTAIPSTVGKLSTGLSSAPQTIQSMCAKSCSPSRGLKVSEVMDHHYNTDGKYWQFSWIIWNFVSSSCPGSLEDWDLAVQKTETKLKRINEQRAKVGAHIGIVLCSCVVLLLLARSHCCLLPIC